MTDEPVVVRLARMEEKLDNILGPLVDKVEKHETRLGALERHRSYVSGAVAAVILILGWVVFK